MMAGILILVYAAHAIIIIMQIFVWFDKWCQYIIICRSSYIYILDHYYYYLAGGICVSLYLSVFHYVSLSISILRSPSLDLLSLSLRDLRAFNEYVWVSVFIQDEFMMEY